MGQARAGLPARGREGTQWMIECPDQKFPGPVAPETQIAKATQVIAKDGGRDRKITQNQLPAFHRSKVVISGAFPDLLPCASVVLPAVNQHESERRWRSSRNAWLKLRRFGRRLLHLVR